MENQSIMTKMKKVILEKCLKYMWTNLVTLQVMRQSGEKEIQIMELGRSLHVAIASSGIAFLVVQTKMNYLFSFTLYNVFLLCNCICISPEFGHGFFNEKEEIGKVWGNIEGIVFEEFWETVQHKKCSQQWLSG